MKNKLYVGNLTQETTEEDLLYNFGTLGTCLSATIIKDRQSGRSKGFAFVEMSSEAEAREAIKTCRGVELDGNRLVVREADPQKSGTSGQKRKPRKKQRSA